MKTWFLCPRFLRAKPTRIGEPERVSPATGESGTGESGTGESGNR